MRKKIALIIAVEVVMAVLGGLVGWELIRPLPETPRFERVVWLPTGALNKGLAATWISQQVGPQKDQRLSLADFQLSYFVERFYTLSERSIIYPDNGSLGPYLLYFGRDAQDRVWAAQVSVSGWSPQWDLPPRPYRPQSYNLNADRSVVEVTTSYHWEDAVMLILVCLLVAIVLLPGLKMVGEFLSDLVGIRLRSPVIFRSPIER